MSDESRAMSGDERFEGPRVLVSKPGQLVLGFAVVMGAVWWAQETWFPEEAVAEEAVSTVMMPEGIDDILAEADMDSAEGPGTLGGPSPAAAPERGLVNLFKRMSGSDKRAAEDEARAEAEASGQIKARVQAKKAPQAPQAVAQAPAEGATPDPTPAPADAQAPSDAQADAQAPQAGAPAAQPAQKPAPAAKPAQEGERKIVRIEDPNGAMKPFYEALRATERKEAGAITRIMQWGDSVIVADMMTATARRKLQERFGDSGHGYMLISMPWEYYIHQNVKHSAADTWRDSLITHDTLKDKHYGLGGVVSFGAGKGHWATFETTDKGKTGRNLSRFVLYYAGQPDGGKVLIQVDGQDKAEVDTKADALTDKIHEVTFPDGPHQIRVQANGGGQARLYGAALERTTPGVVYDCLGVTGSRASTFIRFDKGHFKRQLDLRDPDLLIVMTGSNQSKFKGMDMAQYEQDYTTMVKQLRAARPQSSCLIASSTDRAEKTGGTLATSPLIPQIVAIQRKVALANGCAFWNTYEAMGGQNAIVAWYRHRPRLASGDYTHLTMAGGEVLGTLFYDALMAGY